MRPNDAGRGGPTKIRDAHYKRRHARGSGATTLLRRDRTREKINEPKMGGIDLPMGPMPPSMRALVLLGFCDGTPARSPKNATYEYA